MTTFLSRRSRRLFIRSLVLLATVVALRAVVAGQSVAGQSDGQLRGLPANAGPGTNAGMASRVQLLALNVERAESVRAVKRLQETYAQYSQFGLWTEMASLFSDSATLSYGTDTQQGRPAIQNYFLTQFGEGTHGLGPGALHTQLVLRPVVTVAADGQTAKGRWWQLSMIGRGAKAEWAAGIFENEYVRDGGVWKISRLRYNPMFAGPYATGWRNVDEDQKIVPYHFTPDQAGVPVPDLVASALVVDPKMNVETSLAALEKRIAVMNDEDKVRNLQHAYGYYIDRKMWDDVTDLFTTDGALSIADVGIYDGPKSIRRALERSGPAGLKQGQLHDHMQLDMIVAIEPNGMEARSRGIEFGMLGEADKGTAYYTLAVFENRYVKQNDGWRIREMRIFPLMKADYAKGWSSRVVDPAPLREHAPDRTVLTSDLITVDAIPVFFAANPVTGRPVSLPPGKKAIGTERLVSAPSARTNTAPAGNLEARVKEAERRLAVSKAWDGAENMSSVYGDYLDDLDFGGLAKLFAVKGNKEIPFSGFYVGRESIAKRDATAAPPGSRPRTTLPLHWRTQNVILVAEDGRSASIRSRLFQPQSSRTRAMGFSGGMYHDQVVLENGVWRLWSVAIDEHYFSSPTYEGGWSAARAPQPAAPRAGGPPAGQRAGGAAPAGQPGAGGRGAAPAGGGAAVPAGGRGAAPAGGRGAAPAPANNYPPDIPLTQLGERERGFRGGTGEAIAWPGILPMWFHYKNPVSGRVPPLYWPDCVPCVQFPETSMKNHGYLLPPS